MCLGTYDFDAELVGPPRVLTIKRGLFYTTTLLNPSQLMYQITQSMLKTHTSVLYHQILDAMDAALRKYC